MSSIKRALLHLIRKPGKNLLLFFIIALLTTLTAAAVSIRVSSDNVLKEMQRMIGTKVSIQPESREMYITGATSPYISYNILEEIKELDEVKRIDYSIAQFFEVYRPDFNPETETTPPLDIGYSTDRFYWSYNELSQENFVGEVYLYGASNHDWMLLPFNEASQGRMITQEEFDTGAYVVMLSEQYAEEMGYKVGDTMHLGMLYYSILTMKPTELPFGLEIVGLYDSSAMNSTSKDYRVNNYWYALTTNKVVDTEVNASKMHFRSLGINHQPRITVEFPILELESMEDVAVLQQSFAKRLPSPYKLVYADDALATIAGPIGTLKMIANVVLIVSGMITVSILALTILLHFKERRHEIGIYYAVGKSRRNILIQSLVEIWIIGLMALGIAVFSGNIIADRFSKEFIDLQIRFSETQKIETVQIDQNNEISYRDVATAYKVEISPEYILSFGAIALLSISLATVIPISYVLRLNPKEILL